MKEAESEVYFLAETNLKNIAEAVEEVQPDFLVIDSIQTMYLEEVAACTGLYGFPSSNREGKGDSYRNCRSCDEGRECGRSQNIGAYGRCGALF